VLHNFSLAYAITIALRHARNCTSRASFGLTGFFGGFFAYLFFEKIRWGFSSFGFFAQLFFEKFCWVVLLGFSLIFSLKRFAGSSVSFFILRL